MPIIQTGKTQRPRQNSGRPAQSKTCPEDQL